VKALLDAGADKDAGNLTKDTPLHWAALYGNAATVKTLLDGGARPDVRNMVGETPLHKAAGWGHRKVIKALLKGGADPDLADNSGQTPLQVATEARRATSAALLRAGPLSVTPRHMR